VSSAARRQAAVERASFHPPRRISASHTITDRSITFCNLRMLPSHGYDWNRSRVFLFNPRRFFPAFFAKRLIKYSISRGMSSLRSRRGGPACVDAAASSGVTLQSSVILRQGCLFPIA
jgi:hypothetical protein